MRKQRAPATPSVGPPAIHYNAKRGPYFATAFVPAVRFRFRRNDRCVGTRFRRARAPPVRIKDPATPFTNEELELEFSRLLLGYLRFGDRFG